jgi:drug/metabolite transporter (DMT)-like permease
LAAFASAGTWALASVLYAKALRDRPAAEAVWFKNAVGALALALIALAAGPAFGGGLPPPARLPWLSLSAVCSVLVGDLLYFAAIRRLGVGRAVILSLATPALTALAAWPLRGETLGPFAWLGVALIVAGSAIVELPHLRRGRTEAVGLLAGVGCALAWTAGNLSMKEGIEGVGAISAGAYRLLVATVGMLVIGLLRGEARGALRRLGERASWRRFAAPTLVGTVCGMLLYAAGFKWTSSGTAASLGTAIPIFSVPLAWLLLGERPQARGLLGAAIVLGGAACFGVAVEP